MILPQEIYYRSIFGREYSATSFPEFAAWGDSLIEGWSPPPRWVARAKKRRRAERLARRISRKQR